MSQQEKQIERLDSALFDIIPDPEMSTDAARLVWELGWRPEGWRQFTQPDPNLVARARLRTYLLDDAELSPDMVGQALALLDQP